ncbi:MAG: peroxidase [Deltaproteobacteria bacterium]|nr:peroxidase [Deltaproteobacteria bacterium]
MAPLTEQEQAMLAYVGKLTLRSPEMGWEDTEALRRHGFSDLQILEITMLGAWFNFMTRMADGLGVAVESWRGQWRDFLLGGASGGPAGCRTR